MSKNSKKPIDMRNKCSYRHTIDNVRSLDLSEQNDQMIIEGRAIVFNSETVLFAYDNIEYKETIDRNSLDNADTSECFLKFNHDDNEVVARTKNNSLVLEIREDGLYIRATLANTNAGRDLYELVRTGIIDKMSFAFSIEEESYNEETHTWRVIKIRKLWDVAAVAHPAYGDTELHARRFEDVEALRLQEVETLEARKEEELNAKKAIIRSMIKNKKTEESK